MKIKDLAMYCKSIKINCEICKHQAECNNLQEFLIDLSPCGVIDLVKNNKDFKGAE